MITSTTTNDAVTLPTFENCISAYLHAHGVDLAPGEFVVREARLIRWMVELGLDDQTRAERLAFVERHPEMLLGDELGPAPFTAVDWSLVFPGSAVLECNRN